jgi:glycogen operon protein
MGATWDGSGTNFALFSAHAEKVELCLFDESGRRETARVQLPEYTHEIWHGYLPDVRAGQLYGYRVHGPYEPASGHRFNHHKLLIDPYAKALAGSVIWHPSLFGYVVGEDPYRSFDRRDSARHMPKCRVVDPAFTWGGDGAPARPWQDSVIYEMHVRGFTMRHPQVAQAARGTFDGLCSAAVTDYLRDLGVTAVELMPVHAFVHDGHLIERGLRNYWGYNSVAFFAPHNEYLRTGDISEFKVFVKIMHDLGIEVILDVVYNHTAEGNHLGPTLSMRGIDNHNYYYLMEGDECHYNDFTGTGNSLELRHPQVVRLVTDSLRYWATEMGVDGFRFDLATTLARVEGSYYENASFLDVLGQDPVLVTRKLIAEPWDAGDGGYRLGRFPPGWAEWNDRYRDTVRRFWRGDEGQLPELASRIAGSSDIYDRRGRAAWSSINFVTCHDGFTLQDLLSYEHKRNEANLEENRDGADDNHSWNCGVEGPSDDPAVLELRRRHKCNLLATLLLSQGVPMLLAGDERCHTQLGNNNAYCQDNELTWMDWSDAGHDGALVGFVRRLIALRRKHIVFHRHRFFRGEEIPGTSIRDIVWLRPDGTGMSDGDWTDPVRRSIAFLISGEAGQYHLDHRGEGQTDDSFLVILNAGDEAVEYELPPNPLLPVRRVVFDTGRSGREEGANAGDRYVIGGRSVAVLCYCGRTYNRGRAEGV